MTSHLLEITDSSFRAAVFCAFGPVLISPKCDTPGGVTMLLAGVDVSHTPEIGL